MAEPWPLDTPDPAEKLRKTLRDFIQSRLAVSLYKARLPEGRFLSVLAQGERQGAGVLIIVASEADDAPAWEYDRGNRRALEEHHRITLVVKADSKSGGAAAVSAVHSTLKMLFARQVEGAALIALGVSNLRENPDGFANDPDDADDKVARRDLHLRCSTDVFST